MEQGLVDVALALDEWMVVDVALTLALIEDGVEGLHGQVVDVDGCGLVVEVVDEEY